MARVLLLLLLLLATAIPPTTSGPHQTALPVQVEEVGVLPRTEEAAIMETTRPASRLTLLLLAECRVVAQCREVVVVGECLLV
jgi:hypothetical protein